MICLHAPVDSLTLVAYFRKGGCIYQSGYYMVLYNDSYIEIYVHHPQLFNARKTSFHMYHGGKKLPFEKYFREFGRCRDLLKQRKSCFPGSSAEENIIFRYECTSYKIRLACVFKTILPLIDLSVYLLNLYFSFI